jgi:hypothetical protein
MKGGTCDEMMGNNLGSDSLFIGYLPGGTTINYNTFNNA